VSLTLAEALATTAGDLEGIERREVAGGAVEYVRGEVVFAVVEAEGAGASFHLATAVADAALRTPDTSRSLRGRGWVTLRPPIVDGHARDRATAWLVSAWRTAAGGAT
jgi:hypothetical protein